MVSIILPTYNSIRFLTQRLESILNQTYYNWECIVIDGFSTDGTWEELNELFKKDLRFKLFQYPAKGPYNAWNIGIEKSKGKYIYIATSDDTMELNFLEVMSQELDKNADCGLAHCNLTIIDENGNKHKTSNWDTYYPRRYFGNLMDVKHIRLAPHDGFLHCGLKTVYTSITQLLIRKNVFDKYGYFIENQGTIADYEWGMRVSLLNNILHLPFYLATWRRHEGQLTTDNIQIDPNTFVILQLFIRRAFKTAIKHGLNKTKYSNKLTDLYLYEEYKLKRNKKWALLWLIFKKPKVLYWKFTNKKTEFKNPVIWTQKVLRQYKISRLISIIDTKT